MKKPFFMDKKHQQIIYRTFAVCVCVVIFCEALAFFSILRNRVYQNYREDRQNTLEQIQGRLENFYESFCSAALNISLNADLSNCFYQSKSANWKEMNRRLKQYVGLNGIYSVYIYNAFQDQVYSGTGSHYPYSRADFKDQTALTCVENGFTKGGSSFAFFYRPYLVGEAKNNAVIEQNIFTLVFYPYQTQEIAIVVNSYPEYMLELLRNNEVVEKGVFLLSNQEGEVLFTTNLAKPSVDTERLEAYLTGNRAADMPESLSADGESYSVIYSFSKNLNYHFAWLIPKSEYTDLYFFNDTVFLFVITVVVSLLGLLVVFFGTWRLSVSLSKLLNGLRHTESDLHLAKAGVLKKVVSTMLTPKEMEAIKAFSPIFSAEHLFLVRICIDHFNSMEPFQKTSNRELYKYGMMNICKELFEQYVPAEAISDLTDSILIIAPVFDEYEVALKECQTALKSYLETTVTCIVSDPYPLESLLKAYEQLMQLTQYRFVSEEAAIVTSSSSSESHPGELCEGEMGLIKQALMTHDVETLREALECVMAKAGGFLPIQARLSFIQIAMMFLSVPLYFQKEPDGNELLYKIVSAPTLQEAYDILLSAAEGLRASSDMAMQGQRRREQLLEQCINIVQEHYGNQDLNISYLAEHLQLTSFYLGKIFRESKGIKLSTYITEVRLEKARMLLEDPKATVKGVAEAVGFSSAEYFTVCFKKKYTLSPTQFKENLTAQQNGS